MRILLICLLLVGVGLACEDELKDYLSCLLEEFQGEKKELKKLDKEYTKSTVALVKECFRETDEESERDGLCKIDPQQDVVKRRPFTNTGKCSLCASLGIFMRKKLLVGRKSARRCFNKKLIEITKRETNQCFKDEFGTEVVDFPDLEKRWYKVKTYVIASVKAIMAAQQQIDICEKEDSPAKAAKSFECFIDYKPLKSARNKHCKVADKCLKKAGQCKTKVRKMSGRICECLKIRRNILSENVRNIMENIQAKAKTEEECMDAVRSSLMSDVGVDWLKEISHTIDVCPLPDTPGLDLMTLLRLGCTVAYRHDNWHDITVGIRLVNIFFEAVWARYTRFCPCDTD